MLTRALKRVVRFLDATNSIGVKKLWALKKDNVHYARYDLFNKQWIRDLEIRHVLDVGANVGEFSLIFHHLLDAPSIHAFEPLPSCRTKLEALAESKPNIRFYPHALGSVESEQVLNVSSHAPSSSILQMGLRHKEDYPHSAGSSEVTIQCKRLSDVFSGARFEGNLLIKVDVQGFERNVIEGGYEVFRQAKIVVLEMSFQELYDGEPCFDELYSLLTSLGFTYCGSLKQSVSKNDDSFLQCDGVFVNRESIS